MAVYWYLQITASIDNPNCNLIDMSANNHKPLELQRRYTKSSHDVVEILPEKDLCIFVFRQEIIACNGYDTLICQVVYTIGHGCPIGNMFDMIRYDLGMLKIYARLHLHN